METATEPVASGAGSETALERADRATEHASESSAPPVDRRTILRRPFAAAAAAVGGGLLLAGCDFTSATFDRRVHLLKRLTYGARPPDRDRIAAIGEAAWLNEQLNPASLNTSAVDAKIAALPALSMAPADLFAAYENNTYRNAMWQLDLAVVIRATECPAQLKERMVEFWSDHFNVPFEGRAITLYKIVEDRTTIRPNALGKFKDLLLASATSPAMLVYLDNHVSKVGAINENYGRELLELHTVGVGNFTEADVVNTARLLTGWSVNNTTRAFQYKNANNDPAPLTIMGWTRPTTPNRFTHGVEFLLWLGMQPACARFVCTKIARRFVSDRPDAGLVTAMVNAWLANDSAIGPVLRAMVAHPAFDAAANTKFRRPWDYAAFVLRALRTNTTPTTVQNQLRRVSEAIGGLGQPLFGWPAPNGYPDVEGAWLNTGGMIARWNWTGDVVGRGFNPIGYDVSALRATLTGKTASEIYDLVSQYLMLESVTDAGQIVMNNALGWTDTLRPTAAQIDAALPTMLVAVLGAADAQYR
jgi:uncharacterized protein (DUF1800 family)